MLNTALLYRQATYNRKKHRLEYKLEQNSSQTSQIPEKPLALQSLRCNRGFLPSVKVWGGKRKNSTGLNLNLLNWAKDRIIHDGTRLRQTILSAAVFCNHLSFLSSLENSIKNIGRSVFHMRMKIFSVKSSRSEFTQFLDGTQSYYWLHSRSAVHWHPRLSLQVLVPRAASATPSHTLPPCSISSFNCHNHVHQEPLVSKRTLVCFVLFDGNCVISSPTTIFLQWNDQSTEPE